MCPKNREKMKSIMEHHLIKCIYPSYKDLLSPVCQALVGPGSSRGASGGQALSCMSVSHINSPNPSTTAGMKERSSLIYRENERCEIPQLTRAKRSNPGVHAPATESNYCVSFTLLL